MSNLIQIGSGLLIIVALILSNKKELFTELPSANSMPKNPNKPESGLSLFMNLYPRFGQDFRLADYIQRLKLKNNNPIWNGVYKSLSSRNLYQSKKLPPIIIVPGLGASILYAKWNKKTSEQVQTIDETNNFQQPDEWSCKQNQNEWAKIWPPNVSGLANACWANNTKVMPNENKTGIVNNTGVITTSQEFGTLEFANEYYMTSLIESLEALGYQEGTNLFGANYDFRKIGDVEEINAWCMSLSKLIEQNCYLQENPAIIIGHDLGAVVANYFLVNALSDWKDRYISKFISVSGTFGGCPKALRVLLSGCSHSQSFNNAIQNASGLSLMLPNPLVYGNETLVELNEISYGSNDIPKLIQSVSTEAFDIFNISKTVRDISMKAPGVEVHILGGTNLNTESNYSYKMSLMDEPDKNLPFYRMDLPFNQKFNYNDKFIGDGTMPKFALEYPIFWSKNQSQPVYYQFFTGMEHTKILSTLESVTYIVETINGAID